MARISASLSGFELRLLSRLGEANAAAALSELRLATGKMINRPADDVSAFVALSQFQSQQATVSAALRNVTAASSMVSQAQLALGQIRTQLETIRTKALEDEDQALTAEERSANQAAMDAAITEINRLASTNSGARKVLDGSADFTTTGANPSQISSIDVYSLGSGTSQQISGNVATPAETAELTYTGTVDNKISATAAFSLTGDRGTVTISVTADETLSAARDRINLKSHQTGVAAAVAGNVLTFSSIAYGSQAEVAIDVDSGTFNVAGGNGDGTANGVDAAGTINGQSVTGAGNTFSVNQNGFRFALTVQSGFSGAISTITVSGEALSFALSTDVGRRATLSIPGLQASRLGGASGTLDQLLSGGSAAGLGSNAPRAVRIVDEALGRLTAVEGRVNGFASATIDASESLLDDLDTDVEASIDLINHVDEDREELLIAKNTQLATGAILGLSLLNSQRNELVKLLKSIAGLA